MKKLIAMLSVLSIMLVGCGQQQTAKTDWDYIQSKGEMIIGITYFSPMNYIDDKGKLTGFETEFAEAVCKKLGVKPKFQEIDWSAKETELSSKNIDCIWNGMTVTAERAKNMDLSVSYMQNLKIVIVKNDKIELYKTADDLKNASVVAEKGSVGEDLFYEDPLFAQAKFTAVDTLIKGFLEIKAGTADVCIGDYVMAIGSMGAGSDFEDLSISPYANFEPEEYAIAFRKNSPETVKKVNAAIAELKADGTLDKIAAKYKLGDLLIK